MSDRNIQPVESRPLPSHWTFFLGNELPDMFSGQSVAEVADKIARMIDPLASLAERRQQLDAYQAQLDEVASGSYRYQMPGGTTAKCMLRPDQYHAKEALTMVRRSLAAKAKPSRRGRKPDFDLADTARWYLEIKSQPEFQGKGWKTRLYEALADRHQNETGYRPDQRTMRRHMQHIWNTKTDK